jgi:YfiH family protein
VGNDATTATALAEQGLDWIVPEWPAPLRVHALSTTRNGEAGRTTDFAPSDRNVADARELLRRFVPAEPVWLRQVHGTAIADLDVSYSGFDADGSVTRTPGIVCAVLTADCLPVLLADRDSRAVAVAHAGWRGLAAGVVEAAVAAMRIEPSSLLAWLGPAIGPQAFEVGSDVYTAFCDRDPGAAECFIRLANTSTNMKWHADLYALARRNLSRAGVEAIYGGGRCTLTESGVFHSYRRDGPAANGRMATMIWLGPQ